MNLIIFFFEEEDSDRVITSKKNGSQKLPVGMYTLNYLKWKVFLSL